MRIIIIINLIIPVTFLYIYVLYVVDARNLDPRARLGSSERNDFSRAKGEGSRVGEGLQTAI